MTSARSAPAGTGQVLAPRATRDATSKERFIVAPDGVVVGASEFHAVAVDVFAGDRIGLNTQGGFPDLLVRRVMRAISAYIAQDLIDEEVSMVRDPKRRPEREAVIRREREESSSEMLDALDYWSGDVEFEHELREAIAGVVKAFKKRSRKDVARRSRASMKKAVPDPELARNAGQILDGLKRPGR